MLLDGNNVLVGMILPRDLITEVPRDLSKLEC
jgi:hypothetical protein